MCVCFIYVKCLEVNMNLVFGSEVALLGFWEYMFRILVTVHLPYPCYIGYNNETEEYYQKNVKAINNKEAFKF